MFMISSPLPGDLLQPCRHPAQCCDTVFLLLCWTELQPQLVENQYKFQSDIILLTKKTPVISVDWPALPSSASLGIISDTRSEAPIRPTELAAAAARGPGSCPRAEAFRRHAPPRRAARATRAGPRAEVSWPAPPRLPRHRAPSR